MWRKGGRHTVKVIQHAGEDGRFPPRRGCGWHPPGIYEAWSTPPRREEDR
jgi:hypothetical protein